MYLDLFVRLWKRAVAATILNDFFGTAKEAGMAMKVDFTVIILVPFRIEKEVFGVQ
jgi:cytochrome b